MMHDRVRMAVVRIDRWILGRLLQFPDGVTVQSVHFDPLKDVLFLRVEGDQMPPVNEGDELRVIRPSYCEHHAGDKVVVELLSMGV